MKADIVRPLSEAGIVLTTCVDSLCTLAAAALRFNAVVSWNLARTSDAEIGIAHNTTLSCCTSLSTLSCISALACWMADGGIPPALVATQHRHRCEHRVF